MEAVRVRGVRKTFSRGTQRETVLKNINFSLEEGSFTALTGISGAGKTTLLHLLAGFDKPDEGEILISGRQTQCMKESEAACFRRRHIAVILPETSLLPGLTVEENMILPVRMDAGRLIDEKQLYSILKILHLTHLQKRYPMEMSGGERQRVVFARALFSGAELILADEPTARLDVRNSLELMGMLKRCASDAHRTILMATHDLGMAQICDRELVLKDGCISDASILDR